MELIGIREAARRLGVSDTAVRKAIKAGRVTLSETTTDKGGPQLEWPGAREQWERNTDAGMRTHAGPRKPVAAPPPVMYRDDPEPAPAPVPAPVATPAPAPAPVAAEDPPPGRQPQGPSYAQSRAIREAYQARLAKLDFEERSGKLVDADEVKIRWFKLITAAKTRIMGIPAACKTRIADLPLPVIAAIDAVCREALEDLANERD